MVTMKIKFEFTSTMKRKLSKKNFFKTKINLAHFCFSKAFWLTIFHALDLPINYQSWPKISGQHMNYQPFQKAARRVKVNTFKGGSLLK